MAKKKTRPVDNQRQVQVLQNLGQQAAAWLLGITPRALREHMDVRRADDGTYDARELLAWGRRRHQPASVSDDVYETFLRMAEELHEQLTNSSTLSIACMTRTMTELRSKHGASADGAFVDALLEYSESMGEPPEDEAGEPTRERAEDEIRGQIDREFEFRHKLWCHANLKVSVVCDDCGRLRHGRQWLETEPPAGDAVVKSFCPDCERASKAYKPRKGKE